MKAMVTADFVDADPDDYVIVDSELLKLKIYRVEGVKNTWKVQFADGTTEARARTLIKVAFKSAAKKAKIEGHAIAIMLGPNPPTVH